MRWRAVPLAGGIAQLLDDSAQHEQALVDVAAFLAPHRRSAGRADMRTLPLRSRKIDDVEFGRKRRPLTRRPVDIDLATDADGGVRWNEME